VYYAAQDIIEYLMASTGGGMQDSEHTALRAAAHNAYRDVINARDWHWHVSEATLATDDPENQPGSGDGVKTFTLPTNVKNIDSLIPPYTSSTAAIYLSPTDWLRVSVRFPQINSPVYWTVVRDPASPDRWLLKLAGAPTPAVYKYTYRRRPPMLRHMGYEPQCRTNANIVNGCVVRYGPADGSSYPTSAFGISPYRAQEIQGADASTLESYGGAGAGSKVVWSDCLDVSDSMYTAVLSGAEMWLARLMGKNVEGAMTVYNRDLRLAFESDTAAPLAGTRHGGMFVGTARALGYYSPSGPDVGV
jgi:hypothetical protein